MFFIIKAKRAALAFCALLLLACEVSALYYITPQKALPVSLSEGEVSFIIDSICNIRNAALLAGDVETVKKLYNKDKTNGLYAYDHEVKKIKYLANWSDKQGVKFTSIDSTAVIKWFKAKGMAAYTVNMLLSTEYRYIYINEPQKENMMRIGTYHELDLESRGQSWLITREWYTDPFADSLDLEDIDSDDVKAQILSHEPRDFSGLGAKRITAAAYADKFTGAADSGENGYSYNTQYKSYNNLGGDCANFVSQVLLAGGLKKTSVWNYDKDGSIAWLKARGLESFMIYSGRGSLITSGNYSKALPLSYKLLPGDIVAYAKKGKITHVAVVSGADSKGYALVNCHNTDRYRVPWDLGWSNSGIKFYFLRVNY